MNGSYANGLVARAGGGQSGATAITVTLSRFTTVASVGDSAVLPISTGGLRYEVVNAGANNMSVYPSPGDAINALSANTPVTVNAGTVALFFCATPGVWNSK